jgi:homeobox protein cut-like
MLPMEDDDDGLEHTVEADNVFQTALSKWRDIDFAALQKQLDKQSTDIIEAQKDFLVERKELSTKTKMFRKLPDDEKLLQVMSLLKGTDSQIQLPFCSE